MREAAARFPAWWDLELFGAPIERRSWRCWRLCMLSPGGLDCCAGAAGDCC